MIKTLPEDFSVEERAARGRDFFLDGYNCCQSVLLAFEDILPVDTLTLKALCSGFGGGVGRLREVCGCMSAMAAIAGFIAPADDPSNIEARTENYALVQNFAAAYKEKMGSIVCRDILGLKAEAKKKEIESPRPSERSAEYYKSRPCAYSCETAAAIVADYLLSIDKEKSNKTRI